MPISRTPEQAPFPLRYTEELSPKVTRFSSLPTAATVKSHKLFGIPLVSSLTNEEIADETIEFYINAAISELEHTLDICITPVKFTEKHDYVRQNFTWSHNFTKTDHSPILYVEAVELSFTNEPNVSGFVNFPLEHVHVMPQEGVIQLVPAFGTSLSGFLMSAFSGAQFHALQASGMNNFPGGLRITYTAGFQQDKVPAIMVQLIETIAAINLLSSLGPVLFPQTSVSIGIDGVSQSTGGMGPRHFQDRIEQLEKERERQLDTVRGYYVKKFILDVF